MAVETKKVSKKIANSIKCVCGHNISNGDLTNLEQVRSSTLLGNDVSIFFKQFFYTCCTFVSFDSILFFSHIAFYFWVAAKKMQQSLWEDINLRFFVSCTNFESSAKNIKGFQSITLSWFRIWFWKITVFRIWFNIITPIEYIFL